MEKTKKQGLCIGAVLLILSAVGRLCSSLLTNAVRVPIASVLGPVALIALGVSLLIKKPKLAVAFAGLYVLVALISKSTVFEVSGGWSGYVYIYYGNGFSRITSEFGVIIIKIASIAHKAFEALTWGLLVIILLIQGEMVPSLKSKLRLIGIFFYITAIGAALSGPVCDFVFFTQNYIKNISSLLGTVGLILVGVWLLAFCEGMKEDFKAAEKPLSQFAEEQAPVFEEEQLSEIEEEFLDIEEKEEISNRREEQEHMYKTEKQTEANSEQRRDYAKLVKSLKKEFKASGCRKYKSLSTVAGLFLTLIMLPLRVNYFFLRGWFWVIWFFEKAYSSPEEYLLSWMKEESQGLETFPKGVVYFVCMPLIFLLRAILAFTVIGYFFLWFFMMLEAYIMTLGAVRWQPIVTDAVFDGE